MYLLPNLENQKAYWKLLQYLNKIIFLENNKYYTVHTSIGKISINCHSKFIFLKLLEAMK